MSRSVLRGGGLNIIELFLCENSSRIFCKWSESQIQSFEKNVYFNRKAFLKNSAFAEKKIEN